MSGGPRARRWIFTFFPQSLPDESPSDTLLRVFPTAGAGVTYLIANPEICPETGRPHWQGFACFDSQIRRTRVQAILAIGNAWCDKPRGSIDECITYCTKEESRCPGVARLEHGDRPADVERKESQVGLAIEAIQGGARIRDLVELHPQAVVRNLRGLLFLQSFYQEERSRPCTVEIHFGATETGKTRQVFDRFPASEVYIKNVNNKWWDGYDGHRVILLDEFDKRDQSPGHYFNMAETLVMCDRYPYSREVKCSGVRICPEIIIFTGNACPTTWFGPLEDVQPFMRRITDIYRYQ